MSHARVSSLLHTLAGVYRDPSRVDRDASMLLQSSAGAHLKPIIGELVQNNGSADSVLVMQGTIPMTFRGSTYQCLVDIYLPTSYPLGPPISFVRLAPNMYLKENHAHVGRDGQVYLPYLHEWRSKTHNLVELVVCMSSVFGEDPPVFTKAAPASNGTSSTTYSGNNNHSAAARRPSPPPPYQPSMTANNTGVQAQAEALLAHEAAEANRAAEAARRAAAQEAELEQQRKAQAAWDAKRKETLQKNLSLKLQQQLQIYSKETKQSIQTDFQQETILQHGEKRLENQIKLLREQKETLQQQIEVVNGKTVDIEKWLQQQDGVEQQQLTAEEICEPQQMAHKQMLRLSAENAALTDALYFLDKGLVKGTIGLQQHQKHVRRLAKRQFMVRAHLLKISQLLKTQSYA